MLQLECSGPSSSGSGSTTSVVSILDQLKAARPQKEAKGWNKFGEPLGIFFVAFNGNHPRVETIHRLHWERSPW